MKLFVDDIRNAPDDSWQVARTNEKACTFIYQFKPETISLDHDISHQVGMEGLSRPYPCNDTFMPVAYMIWALSKSAAYLPNVILHTSNPVGAQKMAKLLAEVGIECEIKLSKPANRLEQEV